MFVFRIGLNGEMAWYRDMTDVNPPIDLEANIHWYVVTRGMSLSEVLKYQKTGMVPLSVWKSVSGRYIPEGASGPYLRYRAILPSRTEV